MLRPDLVASTILLALLMVGAPARGRAQTNPFLPGALTRLQDRLHNDSSLPDGAREMTEEDLASTFGLLEFDALPDSVSPLVMRTMAATLRQRSDSACADGLDALASEDGPDWVDALDSSTTEAWVQVLEMAVRARVTHQPPGRVATPEEVQTAATEIFQHLDPDDLQRLSTLSAAGPLSAENRCWSVRLLLDGFAALPSDRLGPILRAMFARGSG